MKIKIKELHKYYDAFSVYKLFENLKDTIFLDSSLKDKNLGRYSFIGLNPILKFEVDNKGNIFVDNFKIDGHDPFYELERILSEFKVDIQNEIPFIGGAMGYFSYDIINNKITDISKSIFFIYKNIIIFDHFNKKTYISELSADENEDSNIDGIQDKLKKYIYMDEKIEKTSASYYSDFQKEDYEKAISKLKEYIRNGDVYVTNMTRRIFAKSETDSFEIYKKLRKINNAPFSAYLNFEDFQILCSSPERFISVVDGKAQTRPIKGTTKRGSTKEEDMYNRNLLINSEKDKSELLMIVDLERNDFSKVCKINTVKVTKLYEIEEYPTVFHLVSTIEGELEDSISSVRCIKECFPGGSITGAPKKRAIEIIDELERTERELYTGTIGYFDVRGNCDFNIVIRTILKKDNDIIIGVGGGITWESDLEAEWVETIYKSIAMLEVI